MLLTRTIVVRLLLAIMALTVSGSAYSQSLHSYALYLPRDRPNGGQYAPIQGRSVSVGLQGNIGRAQCDRGQSGCLVAGLVQSTRPSGARLDHLVITGGPSHRPKNRYGEDIDTTTGKLATRAQVVTGLRYSQQYLPRRLRALHADCVGQDTYDRLRRRHRRLAVQLRSARE
jgi:hypothetical protein